MNTTLNHIEHKQRLLKWYHEMYVSGCHCLFVEFSRKDKKTSKTVLLNSQEVEDIIFLSSTAIAKRFLMNT